MISVFDLFKIGIGPSSSHTMGPMRAARAFADHLGATGILGRVKGIRVELLGSLAWTGRGHATPKAVVLGLGGADPATVDPDAADAIFDRAQSDRVISLAGSLELPFDPAMDIVLNVAAPSPSHPNTLVFVAHDENGEELATQRWCSVGGGFIVPEGHVGYQASRDASRPHDFRSGADLLEIGEQTGKSIADIMRANEMAELDAPDISRQLKSIACAMMACIDRGLRTSGELPGGLNVVRRAPTLFAQLSTDGRSNARRPAEIMDFISVFAIAVNEENAAGGRVVTAPTNGAAGVVPAVLRYYRDFCDGANEKGIEDFLLTGAAIGALFKMNASISGAEVGCQGEVGVACSMAAAGLAAALGGSNAQIENAAEIGMEHHLGMTCDPVGGLVQIPCIERNAFGAIKAVNAASLALHGDGVHRISLDQVISAMRQTGADMNHKYKETSLGGLAVNWVEC